MNRIQPPLPLFLDPYTDDKNSKIKKLIGFSASFTNFRPPEAKIQDLADRISVTIVHGHNGDIDTTTHSRVIGLNARLNNMFAPVAALVGLQNADLRKNT